jgi:hypothetical protein
VAKVKAMAQKCSLRVVLLLNLQLQRFHLILDLPSLSP